MVVCMRSQWALRQKFSDFVIWITNEIEYLKYPPHKYLSEKINYGKQ